MKCFSIALHHIPCNFVRTGRVNHDTRHGGSFRKKNIIDPEQEGIEGGVFLFVVCLGFF